MNKKQIDGYLFRAYSLLRESGVAGEDNRIPSVFRGYISSFGAAIIMGSLKAAIAFYSAQNGANREREKLMNIICALVEERDYKSVRNTDLLKYVINSDDERYAKEKIYNAAIAIKLAMNMYTIDKENSRLSSANQNGEI